jgi:hypothetical protein
MAAERVHDIHDDELTDEALDRSDGGRFMSSFVHDCSSFFTKRYEE